MGALAVNYFQNLLSSPQQPARRVPIDHFLKQIQPETAAALITPISDAEITKALHSIPDNKAPGPDGFTSCFFKKAWGIIGPDFLSAIHSFFRLGTIPRCVNSTAIALVPKVESPTSLNDYRPISCYTVIYKCIAKVLSNRIKAVLLDIIGPSQSAFVQGRLISDNILLSQELLRNYHLNGPPRCALKVDNRKAFDTISWNYITEALKALGFPH